MEQLNISRAELLKEPPNQAEQNMLREAIESMPSEVRCAMQAAGLTGENPKTLDFLRGYREEALYKLRLDPLAQISAVVREIVKNTELGKPFLIFSSDLTYPWLKDRLIDMLAALEVEGNVRSLANYTLIANMPAYEDTNGKRYFHVHESI